MMPFASSSASWVPVGAVRTSTSGGSTSVSISSRSASRASSAVKVGAIVSGQGGAGTCKRSRTGIPSLESWGGPAT